MIKDKQLVFDFWGKLDQLQKDEIYMMLGGARKKYAKGNHAISTSHEIITRQMVRQHDYFKFFYQAVRKTDALLNVSIDKNTEKDFPKESHVIYISINPRSTIKAKGLCDEIMNHHYYTLLSNESEQGRIDAYKQIKRFKVHYYSDLQKAPSNTKWRILDIDIKNEELINHLIEIVNPKYIKFITETHGGYHIIYDRRANEYLMGQKLLKLFRDKYALKTNQLEMFKDRLTPIWGTEQGGFMVRPYTDY